MGWVAPNDKYISKELSIVEFYYYLLDKHDGDCYHYTKTKRLYMYINDTNLTNDDNYYIECDDLFENNQFIIKKHDALQKLLPFVRQYKILKLKNNGR